MGRHNRGKRQLNVLPAGVARVAAPSAPQASDTRAAVAAESRVVPRVRKPSLLVRAKKVAWRVTGVCAWLWFISLFIFGASPVDSAESWLAYKFSAFLSAVGFAPVNGAALPFVLKAGWLLVITGFNPAQVAGLVTYIFLAPVWVPVWYFYREHFAEALSRREATESHSKWPALSFCTAGLVGWFMVYGEAASVGPISVGVVLSGLVLLLFIYRALQRTKPLTFLEVSVLGGLERFTSIANGATENEKKKPVSKGSEAAVNVRTYGGLRTALIQLAFWIHGKRGKDRVYMFVLVEYMLFLFMLAFAGILFWALAAKAASAPHYAPLSTFFYFSASHFLPGVSPPVIPWTLPLAMQVGPSLTAWVLFVVFVGPAASLVPIRQTAYGTRLAATYVIFRRSILSLSAYLRRMEKLKRSLPG